MLTTPYSNTLAAQTWHEVTLHHVHVAFLRAEWSHISNYARSSDYALIDTPDLENRLDNARRADLLYARRGPLLQQVPADSRWFEVKHLQEPHLTELHVIGRCGWDHPGDRNELLKVAARRRLVLTHDPEKWSEPILWTHARNGPFTILEGNNRLVAYASANPRPVLKVTVFIGLSERPCFWHLPDPPTLQPDDLMLLGPS